MLAFWHWQGKMLSGSLQLHSLEEKLSALMALAEKLAEGGETVQDIRMGLSGDSEGVSVGSKGRTARFESSRAGSPR